MGVLSKIDVRFEEVLASPDLAASFGEWKERREALAPFEGPAEMVAFIREQNGSYEDRDRIIWALCQEARSEKADGKPGRLPRPAADCLLGLFAPGLWRVFEEVRASSSLAPSEIEAEIALGFWEAVADAESHLKLSGRLVNSARHRAWGAANEEGRAGIPDDNLPAAALRTNEEVDWSDPWLLLCWAEAEGALNEVQTELIFWTRLQGNPLSEVAEALGLTYDAARHRRHRAEKRLASWLEENRDRYPPQDAEIATRVVTRALSEAPSGEARVPPAHFLNRDPDTKPPSILFEQMRGAGRG